MVSGAQGRTTILVVGALMMGALAGCAGPAEPDGPEATLPEVEATGSGTVLANLTSASCIYNDVIFLVPREQAQALLPEGFRARAFLHEGTGAIVTNVIACGEGFAWNAADAFVAVERIVPPAWMEAFDAANRTPRQEQAPTGSLYLDLYMLAAFTEHEELAAIFERAGMPVSPAQLAKTSLPAPLGSAAQGSVTDGSGPILTYTVTGRPLGEFLASHRQWRETPEGLVLVERYMSSNGEPIALTQGAAQCVVRPGSLIAEITDGVPCSLGQDIMTEFSWEGHAYLFPGTSGATFTTP